MDILEQLKNNIGQISNEFDYLLEENRKLKEQVKQLQEQNDILIRNSQDAVITIKNKLKQGKNI